MLRDKVKEILTKKLEKQQVDKETNLNSGDEPDRKEDVERLTIASSEPAQDVPELGLNTEEEEAKSADKYSTTFESDEEFGNSVKTVSDAGDNIPDTPEEKTEASSETDGEPDHVEAVDVEPALPPPDSEYQQKMLSTIEEVTTVADTEDNEEDYSDNFVSSNISSNPDQAQGSETSDTESNDVTELESKAVDKTDGEDKFDKEDKMNTTDKLVTFDKIDAAKELEVDVDKMDQTSKVVQNYTEDNGDKSGTVDELDIADEENLVDKIDKLGEADQIDTSENVDLVEKMDEVKTEDGIEEIQKQIEPLSEESVRDDTINDIETSKLESVTEVGDVSVKEESDVFVPLPLELTQEDSLKRDQDTEEQISQHQHDVVGEDGNGDHGEDVHDGLDEDVSSLNEDTDDNIETGVLSSDDLGLENKSEGIEVTEIVEGVVNVDPEDVDILKLDIETGFLTPDRLDTTDPGFRLSPSLRSDLTLPGETDQDQVTSAVTDTDPVRLSEGEVIIKISDTSEEGEVSAGDTLETREASEETSEGELSRLSRGEAKRGRRLVTRPEILETSSSSSSGWSEGEWRASPGRMRRFLNMAAAFRMIKESD